MTWQVTTISKPKHIRSPVLVEGLPGIGNVGKLAVDYIIEQLRPQLFYEFYSQYMPHTVFINKQNIVELPKLGIYALKGKRHDVLVLAGDMQPVDEYSCHSFVETVLEICKSFEVKQIITLGGIGHPQPIDEPQVFITGNCKEAVDWFADQNLKNELTGIVGHIIGVTGLLVALAKKYDIKAVALLADSYAHPLHIGIKEARALLSVLINKLGLRLKLDKFDKEIKQLELVEKARAKELSELKSKPSIGIKERSYIG